MARLRYIADNPRGPRGGNHDVRTLFSSFESASRNVFRHKDVKPGCVLLVDLDELLSVQCPAAHEEPGDINVAFDKLFAWHEARIQHHAAECTRIRGCEGSGLPLLHVLTTHDLALLREVVSEWDLEEDRLRRGGGATPAASRAFFVLRELLRTGKLGGRPR